MPPNVDWFAESISGGVNHVAEADIETIRDLLRGYGSTRSILKELVQNAEDAGATDLEVMWVPGHPAAVHPLLKGPGLVAVNNGKFYQANRHAIRQINLGTKGADDRAIGRFGKGLKSVFAWCEAFFIIAKTNPAAGWPETAPIIADFFNPWHGWRHGDWHDAFSKTVPSNLVSLTDGHLSATGASLRHWLAFWFPLRRQEHDSDAEGKVDWIFDDGSGHLPGSDPNFVKTFCAELESLSPSLVNLRSLERVRISDHGGQGTPKTMLWDLPKSSDRIPSPDEAPSERKVVGASTLRLPDGVEQRTRYVGFAGRLPDHTVAHLKAAQDWPKVATRTRGGSGESAKGEPHFSTLISCRDLAKGAKSGHLEIRWCVFFPVGKQPTGTSPSSLQNLPKEIVINLHGFFFLDSDRLRIDGLEDRFELPPNTRKSTCPEWNRIVASEGTLTHLPAALAAFCAEEQFTSEQTTTVAQAVLRMWVWEHFREQVCRKHTWRPRWRPGKEEWELMPSDSAVYVIPHFPKEAEILRAIPAIASFSNDKFVVVRRPDGVLPGLHESSPAIWPEASVIQLLRGAHLKTEGEDGPADWLNNFLNALHKRGEMTPLIRNQIADLALLPVTDARSGTNRRMSSGEWETATTGSRLVQRGPDTEDWLRPILAALPGWTCQISDGVKQPAWFDGSDAGGCGCTWAAEQVLSQAALGKWPDLAALMVKLTAERSLDDSIVCAARFLMHASPAHARDGQTLLFLSSRGHHEQVWSRLLKQILEKREGDQPWRLLHNRCTGILPGNRYGELNVVAIDAAGMWKELIEGGVDVASLEFGAEDWSLSDISTLIIGLFTAGQKEDPEGTKKLLRRLKIHSIRGRSKERLAISGEDGDLAEGFVLNTPGFDVTLPEACKALWQEFLALTRVVERIPPDDLASGVQRQLFQTTDDEGSSFIAELDWNFVVRRCLDFIDPCTYAGLILEALSHGDLAVQGVGKQLKATEWLTLIQAGAIAPSAIVSLDGLESELETLLDPAIDGIAGVRNLQRSVRDHKGFGTLRKYLPGTRDALQMLATNLENKPDWHIGLTENVLPEDLDDLLNTLETVEILPGGSLLAKLHRLELPAFPDGLEPVLRETVWKSMLRPFSTATDGVTRLEKMLVRFASPETRKAFDCYLRQASADGQIKALLPRIRLVNRSGHWRPASELTWPSANLNPSAQVCDVQAIILDGSRAKIASANGEAGVQSCQANNFELKSVPDFANEVKKLKEYLRPLQDSNVGPNLPAALVAVLGGHPAMIELLEELLGADIRQNRGDFLLRLLGESHEDWLFPAINETNFLIEVTKGRNISVSNLGGDPILVDLSNEVESLLVGDPADLWWRRNVRGSPGSECRLLRLRQVTDPDEQLTDPVIVFSKTIEMIMNSAYNTCPEGTTEAIAEISQAGQADLKRSQEYLLEVAEARLKELGARESPKLEAILRAFEQARLDRIDSRDLKKRGAHPRAGELASGAEAAEAKARSELRRLLTEDGSVDVRRMLVGAVRRKIVDFDYSIDSVILELFQNADDAVSERTEMGQVLEPGHGKFVVRLDPEHRQLEIFHWGRAINQFSYGSYSEGRKRGFDQDLQKMLTLNFSDKGIGIEGIPNSVTGRFGLGFKSVFFVSEEPKVVSGRLGFRIRGGFFPVSLPPDDAKKLRENAAALNDSGLVPTAITLEWTDESNHQKLIPVLERFRSVAPLLTVFSRCLGKVVISEGDDEKTYERSETSLTPDNLTSLIRVGSAVYIAIRCQIPHDQRPATILIPLDSQGASRLPEQMPSLWITTPTTESSEFRWALNAPFKPDAGRQRLALNNPENRNIAQAVAGKWGTALLSLFDAMHEDWQRLSTELKLDAHVTPDGWWTTFWNEATRAAPVHDWAGVRHGGQILSWIAWNDSGGAVQHLVRHRAAIPSQLPRPYDGMVKSDSVTSCVEGLLGETTNGPFIHVAQWKSMQGNFPLGTVVGESVGVFLEKARTSVKLTRISLQQVLAVEIGTKCEVIPDSAHRIGSLLAECRSYFGTDTRYSFEVGKIDEWLSYLAFRANDGQFHPAQDLVCSDQESEFIDHDEAHRAKFAPASAVLSEEYSAEGLAFFVRARGRLSAGATHLADWVNRASDENLPIIFKYLILGNLGQELADILGRPWLDSKRQTTGYVKLSPEDKSELERKFLKGCDLTEFIPDYLAPQKPEDLKQEMDAGTAFRLIKDWWNREWERRIRGYTADTYPPQHPGGLPFRGEDAWDQQSQPNAKSDWLVLFIDAALVSLGLNRIGRNREFMTMLVRDGFLDDLVHSKEQPERLIKALDGYLQHSIDGVPHHFPMRQFISFYAVARHLDAYVDALAEADRSQSPGAFTKVFSPNTSQILSGTGIRAPAIGAFMGIGKCQMLRELYRLGRLSNPAGHPYAYTPIRKVRRLFLQLFGEEVHDSVDMHRILTELAAEHGGGCTFRKCFDIPFQLLAEDKKLRTQVLDTAFEAEDSDDEEVRDAAALDLTWTQ